MKTERKRWGASLYIYHVYHRLKNIKKHYGWPSFLQRAEKGWRKYDLPQNEHANVTSSKKELSLCFLYSLDILHLGAQLLLYINLEPRRYLNREKKVGRVFEVHGFSR
jgi:hypothetical protein